MHVNLHSSDSFSRSAHTLSSNETGQRQTPTTTAPKAEEQLLNTLSEHIPGVSASELKSLNANDFTPEKVAGRISGFVAQGLEQARRDGKSEEQIAQLHQQAMQGIEKGFSEARTILDEMNLLTPDIADTIDRTYDLTLDAVNALAPTSASKDSNGTGLMAAERFQHAESFSLQLRTQDGDKVTIDFANQSSYSASLGAYNDGEGNSAAVFSIDRSAQSNFQFSVKGELDAEEIDAIQNLIKDVSVIADDFFGGNVQAAFEKATEFQLDKSELSAMHLRLTQTQQYSAAAAYQQVQGYQPQSAADQGNRMLGHLTQDFAERTNNPALSFLESPLSLSRQLLDNLVQQDIRYQQADAKQQDKYDQGLVQIKALLEQTAVLGTTSSASTTQAQ